MEKYITPNKRVYFGIFLIVIGAFLVLVKLNVFPEYIKDELVSLKMLLIGVGIFSIISGNKTLGTILVVIGGIFMAPVILGKDFKYYEQLENLRWPLLIIGVGMILLVTRGQKKSLESSLSGSGTQGMDFFDDFVIFGGREVFVNSQNFYGGKITSMFGGAEYDLRQAGLSENGAVVDCVSVFGACEFKVPPDWTVKNEVTAIFGAFSDKRGNSFNQTISNPSKTLIVKGFSAFGAIEIKY